MTLEEILDAARKRTGLADPDSDSWRQGLEILIRDHHKVDLLNERGWANVKTRYIDSLSSRMGVDDFMRRNPAAAAAPVKRPVFILGMPRTGTTMVSYLMGSDPATRSLLKWEAYNITPPAAPGALKTDPRCLAELAKDEAMLKANPNMFAAHYEAGDGPTECVYTLGQDFKSLFLAIITSTPTYHDWILMCDMMSAFAHRKRVLQVLQTTNGGRWVLKMPSDALFIRTLFATFPDARVIWTHRDPYATFASSINMRAQSRPHFQKDMDLAYMRDRYPLQMAFHVMRPLQMSRERPNDIHNVYYDDLVADPIAQMKKVYAWLGDPWTDTVEAGMRGWLNANPQGRFGTHTYSLAKWGMSKQDLVPYFADYLKVHPVATGAEA